jgi:hypothetical protein
LLTAPPTPLAAEVPPVAGSPPLFVAPPPPNPPLPVVPPDDETPLDPPDSIDAASPTIPVVALLEWQAAHKDAKAIHDERARPSLIRRC